MNKKKTERECSVCGSVKKKVLFQQSFAFAPEGSLLDGYDVVICLNCGFGFADKIPEQDAFDAYYENMSKYEYEYKGGESDFDARRFPVGADFIRSLVADSNVSILDIGCTNGGFLHALRQVGFRNVSGVDPSPICAQNAARLYGIEVLTGTLSRLPENLKKYDLVILSAVLEHVRDLNAALMQVRKILNPGSLLYVEVPDLSQFNNLQDAPFQEFSVEHVNYFSVFSLTNLLMTCGFERLESMQSSTVQRGKIISPELKMMCRMVDMPMQERMTYDAKTQEYLEKYIESSRAIESRIHTAIDRLVKDGRAIIVWGVGTHTQRLMAKSSLSCANIVAFVDSNPKYQSKSIKGIPIIAPKDLLNRQEPILISSSFFQQEIEQHVRSVLGLKNEMIMLYEH
ncbi:MAG: methyltransferase domain-containing protein [SAR324 cluster bacterium]|uniref:Methyltransferase domain-containing protein n=1 Tax=SAR324 cluster bacterium TaxID=2024889 RepID=A0A7X9IMU2_9DELT|nr:methyltransferase domain-containing protein [SAR324 cluster bacterium]